MLRREVAHGNIKRVPITLHKILLLSKNISPTKTPNKIAGLHKKPTSSSQNAKFNMMRYVELFIKFLSTNIDPIRLRLP